MLLYGFILLVVRSATRGMEQTPPQESIVLGAAEAAQLRAEHGLAPAKLLVLASPELAAGARSRSRRRPSSDGTGERDPASAGDEFASGRHARIEPRHEGVWLDDLGSTNGTFVNGKRLERAQLVQRRRRDPRRRDRAAGAGVRIGRAAWLTDTGRRRVRNEDAYVFEPPLFAIADGMGGARAGEVAAGLAAAALKDGRGAVSDEASLEARIAEANRQVWERSVADPRTAGMGTTVTVAFVDQPASRIVFGHVGDSRAYRLRGNELEQVTTDHSLVAELVESGVLTPDEAERHPQRSAITRAVGTERAIEADVFSLPGEVGDLFLLCSDGLTDMLSEAEIAGALVAADRDPEAAARALVDAANAHGGEDNITVVLFELVEGAPEDAAASADRTEDVPSAETGEPAEDVRTHGAGPGGQLTALVFLVLVVVVGLLGLYWGIKR